MESSKSPVIAEVTRRLVLRNVASPATIAGCTSAEIDAIKQSIRKPLPEVYEQFLTMMGRQAGRFFQGTDMYYPAILGLNEDAAQILEEESAGLVLPETAIVFSMHQGYQFMFMSSDEGDDPPVYYYIEGADQFVRKYDHFSQFLLDATADSW